jgi:hypothetical protein
MQHTRPPRSSGPRPGPISARDENLGHPVTAPRPEQRAAPRFPAARPCRLYHHATGRYLSAWTCDVSAGGTLLRVRATRRLRPGEQIDVLIAWHDHQLLHAADQVRGTVTRTLDAPDRSQLVAIRFALPAALPLAA